MSDFKELTSKSLSKMGRQGGGIAGHLSLNAAQNPFVLFLLFLEE
jgi:hypothetical protein